jgi:tRNA dimethylallyltransferase
MNHRGADTFPPLVDQAIVLTGPTAAGKSAVAVALAERIGGEILSLDSIAVYRGMDIGTAKPALQDRHRVAHHLIDVVEPTQEFSVACYLREAHRLVGEIRRRGQVAIFVGGTPMFLKAVLRGFDPGPPADWEFRRAVEADIERHGLEALRQRLRQVDPLAAHRIDAHDARRMIRALEVARSTGTPISHRQVQFDHGRDAESCNVLAIHWPRHELHTRINARVRGMFEAGLVDEVRSLLQQFGQLSRTASQAVGYREVMDWLSQGGDLRTLIEDVAAHTRQLARRQETWLRSFCEIRSIEVHEPLDPVLVAGQIAGLLR